jgi:hypothetical protein
VEVLGSDKEMGSVEREREKSVVCMFAAVQGEALLFVFILLLILLSLFANGIAREIVDDQCHPVYSII